MEQENISGKYSVRLKWPCLILAVLLPLFWLGFLRGGMLNVGECSNDAFYHVKMAEMGSSVFLAKKFPWTAISIWNDRFADKELLYHASLSVLTSIRDLLGISPEPPFHFLAMPFLLAVMAAFVYAAYRLGVSPPTILCSSLLTALIAPNFTFRLLMLRPHVFSIALLFLTSALLARGSLKFRAIAIFIISFVYSWSYSNPHFIVIPVLCFSIFAVRRDSWRVLLLPLISFAGVILGLLIHPQFPNSFLIWKLQSWDALVTPMSASSLLGRPSEMLTPGMKWHIPAIPIYIMVYFNILMLIRLTERKGFRNMNPNLYALTAFSLLFTVGIFMALRSVEYAAPFNVLLLAMLFDECLKENILIPMRNTAWKPRLLLASSGIICAILTTLQCISIIPQSEYKPIPKLAQWLKENIPSQEKVINIEWSDFPLLFYYDSEHYWLWGMDPVFALAANPTETLTLSACRIGSRGLPPQKVYDTIGIKYAVLLAPRNQNMEALRRRGWQLVYEGEDGWVFKLN